MIDETIDDMIDEVNLKERYFAWICKTVGASSRDGKSYQRLLRHLFHKDFQYLLDMDENRFEDGIDLRYRFGYEEKIDRRIIASVLDIRPCSVLEMMAALAYICEEHIMHDDDLGDRTGVWFFGMIESLGLADMTDERLATDQRSVTDFVDGVIEKFLDRNYEKNGAGGLFTVEDSQKDMRTVEIWHQMCWYLKRVIQQTYTTYR